MPDHLTSDEALQRLAAAARNGNRAKRRLIRKLANMTPSQLRRVNPDILARLGPEGLSMFASLNKSIANVALAPPPVSALLKQKETLFERFKRRWHFAHPLLKCLAVTALCGVLGVAAERISNLLQTIGGRGTEIVAGWPVCARLDLDERGCVYRATSGQLTIAHVVALTGLRSGAIVAANPHLDFRFVLPSGSLVVVPKSHP